MSRLIGFNLAAVRRGLFNGTAIGAAFVLSVLIEEAIR